MAIEILDEHEQGEVVRNWLKQYGGSLIGGAVLGIGALIGVQQWQQHSTEQRAEAGVKFQALTEAYEARDLDLAESLAADLRAKAAKTPYAALASLRQADHAIESGNPEQAAEALTWALENSRNSALKELARLRLARVTLTLGDAEAALAHASAVAENAYAALAAEVRGDALLALGRRSEASDAYRAALEGEGANFGRGEVLRMKLDSLGASQSTGSQS
jgi:predicted negative regulator of RcsB-dependent stress response